MRLLLSLSWRDSASRKQLTLLTVLSVAVAVGLILATRLSGAALEDQLRARAAAIVGRADAEVFAFSERGFSPEMVDVIRKLPEVAVASPLVVKRVNGRAGDTTEAFDLRGIDPEAEQQLHPLELESGRMFGPADTGDVVVDADWARSHNVSLASTLVLFTADGPGTYKVVGLMRDDSLALGSSGAVVLVPLSSAQGAFRLGARVSQVSVGFRGAACAADCPQYPDFRAHLREAALEEYSVRDNHTFYSGQRQPFAEIQPIIGFFTLLAVGVGIFLIYNNLAVTVAERRREIGLMRAAGATAGWIRRLFTVQGALLGFLGSVLGLVLGTVVAVVLTVYLARTAGTGWTGMRFDPAVYGLVGGAGLLASILATSIPARRASQISPMEALRPPTTYRAERRRLASSIFGLVMLALAGELLVGEVVPPPGLLAAVDPQLLAAGGIALVLIGIIALTPLMVRPLTRIASIPLRGLIPDETMLARNALVRTPNRTALTIAGLFVSSALIVSVAGLSQGALGAGTAWVNSLFVADQVMVSPVSQSDDVRKDVAALSGVASVSPVAFFSLRTEDRAVNLAAIDPADYAAHGKLEFVAGSRSEALGELGSSRAVLVSRRFALDRNVGVGDRLSLGAGAQSMLYRVAGIVAHSLPAPGGEETALISLVNARQDFGVEGFNLLQVVPAGELTPELGETLSQEAQRYGMQLQHIADLRAQVARGLNQVLQFLTGVGLVGVILGLFSVVTTIFLNIGESSREFGLLRAVGMTRQQIRGIVLSQSAMLGVSGALLGAAVGLLIMAVMVRSVSSTSFAPAYAVPWEVLGALLVAALMASALAVLLPARRAAARSVVAAVRYE